jgi:hypothetical protein
MIKFDKLPKRMAHLKLDPRGYPIPFFVKILNGEPEFRLSDPKKKEICRKQKKCWICGKPLLAKSFWYITGPIGLSNQVASDEAMHEECARFSLKICPHMFYEKAERTSDQIPDLAPMPSLALTKPQMLFLVQADKIQFLDNIHTWFRSQKAEAYHYVNNKLEFLNDAILIKNK